MDMTNGKSGGSGGVTEAEVAVRQLQAELLGDADAMKSIVKVFSMLLRWDREARFSAGTTTTEARLQNERE